MRRNDPEHNRRVYGDHYDNGDPLDRIAETLPAAWSRLSVVSLRVDDVLALVEIARAAREPVDIGDEINRCRLCWEAWGKHANDCPVARLEKD